MLLRVTELNQYMECSAKFMFSTIEKIHVPRALPLAVGTAVHKALETNYGQKIETKRDLPKSDVLDAFADEFERQTEEVESTEFEDTPKGEVKDQGINLVAQYQDSVAPTIQPAIVEKRIEVEFDPSLSRHNLSGQIDLIDDAAVMIDHKTTARTPSEPSYGNVLQATMYRLLAKADGIAITENRIDYLVNKKKPELRSFIVEPDEAHAARVIKAVSHGIDQGVFVPNRSSILCSHKWCKFAPFCEAKYGGKVKQ